MFSNPLVPRRLAVSLTPLTFLLLLAAWLPAAGASAVVSTDTGYCVGYSQQREFLESQEWWMPGAGQAGNDFGHIHVGTCFPWGQTIGGVQHFDIRVMLHNNPGVLTKVQVQIFGSGAPDPVVKVPMNVTCPTGDCTWWVPVDIDTAQAKDGCQEFRFQAFVTEPDGNKGLATDGWRVYLKNGNPQGGYCDSDSRKVNVVEGRGWYTNVNYEVARLQDPLPTAPVKGTWSPNIRMLPGAAGIPVTYHYVAIDPAFHQGYPGIIVNQGIGQLGPSRIPIDTTQLSNGLHHLFIRTDAASSLLSSTLSGGLLLPFTVAN